MKNILYIIACSISLLSCERRELTYDYAPYYNVTITADWSALEAAPSGMSVIFYPQDGSNAITIETNNIASAKASLREGKYNIVIFNQIPSDFGTIGFKGVDKFETIEVYAKPTDSKWYKTKGDEEIVARTPEYLAVATYLDFEVTKKMVEEAMKSRSNESKSLPLTEISLIPKAVVNSAIAQINIDGIHNLRNIRATISGLSSGYHIASGKSSSSTVTHLLEGWDGQKYEGSYTDGYIYISFSHFGLPNHPTEDEDKKWEGELSLEMLLIDNKTIVKEDITVEGETVLLPNVEPEGGGNSGGFDADVDEWGDEDIIDIPL